MFSIDNELDFITHIAGRYIYVIPITYILIANKNKTI